MSSAVLSLVSLALVPLVVLLGLPIALLPMVYSSLAVLPSLVLLPFVLPLALLIVPLALGRSRLCPKVRTLSKAPIPAFILST